MICPIIYSELNAHKFRPSEKEVQCLGKVCAWHWKCWPERKETNGRV